LGAAKTGRKKKAARRPAGRKTEERAPIGGGKGVTADQASSEKGKKSVRQLTPGVEIEDREQPIKKGHPRSLEWSTYSSKDSMKGKKSDGIEETSKKSEEKGEEPHLLRRKKKLNLPLSAGKLI